MEINNGLSSSSEAKQKSIEFATRLLNLQISKKQIDEDIKALKAEFLEQGVAVNVIAKAVSKIKTNKKMTESQLYELDTITAWLEGDQGVSDSIVELMQG